MSIAFTGRIGNDYFAYAQAGGNGFLNDQDLSLNQYNYNNNSNYNCDFGSILSGMDKAVNNIYNGYWNGFEQPIAANEKGTITGDPHFKGGDGDTYDVQGQAGKTYNLLSDTGLSYNGRFDKWGNGGATVVGESAINVSSPYGEGNSVVTFTKTGDAKINGKELKDGQTVQLADGGTANKKGNVLTVTTAEGYTITQTAMPGGYINSEVKTGALGVSADSRLPGGLLGQTFDTDKVAKRGTGMQGEGVIAGKVQDYETSLYKLDDDVLDQNGNSTHNNNLLGLFTTILSNFLNNTKNDKEFIDNFTQVLTFLTNLLNQGGQYNKV